MVFMSGWAAAFLTNLYDKVINKVPFLLKKFQRVYVTKLSTIWGGVVQNLINFWNLDCYIPGLLAFYDVFESVYIYVLVKY